MTKFKKPLFFALIMFPIGLAAGLFTGIYQLDIYAEEMLAEIIAQLGSVEALLAVSAVQSALYAAVCGFFGYILAGKLGLWKPVKFEKSASIKTAVAGIILGIVFILDYWTFGRLIPAVGESYAGGVSAAAFIASVLYGGIIEEIMLRLFVLSLLAFIIWKLFCRKSETAPAKALIAANIAAALIFAAGHLPATLMSFGEITPLILLRCFILNGGFGLVFGRIYLRRGVHHAMLAHALTHIVAKIIWILFI